MMMMDSNETWHFSLSLAFIQNFFYFSREKKGNQRSFCCSKSWRSEKGASWENWCDVDETCYLDAFKGNVGRSGGDGGWVETSSTTCPTLSQKLHRCVYRSIDFVITRPVNGRWSYLLHPTGTHMANCFEQQNRFLCLTRKKKTKKKKKREK